MTEYLTCQKCGAVLTPEGYHQYSWYLDGKKVAGCPPEIESVTVKREDLRNFLAAIEGAEPALDKRDEYRRLRGALEGK